MELQQIKDLKNPNIKIEKVGDWLWVSGKTYNIKEKLKEMGFLFSSSKRAWFFNGEQKKTRKSFYKDLEELKNKWGYEVF